MAQKAFLSQLKKLEEGLEKVRPIFLRKVVEHLVTASPDDTGAYILSHSMGSSPAVGYSISSRGRPSERDAHRGEAYSNLMTQVGNLKNATYVWVGNKSPHADVVEYGGYNWRRGGYYVYSELRNIMPMLFEDAVIEAGLK